MSDLKLNLNDFKAVLGVKNDGNVMVSGDKLVKVNFGNKLTRFFRPKVDVKPEENAKMRKAFMAAIENSREGKLLQQEKINEIKRELGIKVGDGEENTVLLQQKLTRRKIDEIIRKVVGNDPMSENYQRLVDRDVQFLKERDIYAPGDMEMALNAIEEYDVYKSVDSMVAFAESKTPEQLFGFTKSDILKFVRNNAAELKEMAFLRLCHRQNEDRAKGLDSDMTLRQTDKTKLFFVGIRDLMQTFAKHRETSYAFEIVMAPPSESEDLQTELMNDKQLDSFNAQLGAFDALLDKMFPVKQPSIPDAPLARNDLFNARANANLKLAFREALKQALNENEGSVERAIGSKTLEPFASLMKLTARVDGKLTDGAIASLHRQFGQALLGCVHRGEDLDPNTALKTFSKLMKPFAEALDPETYLRDAFVDSGLSRSKYASLKAELMPGGQLTEPNLGAVNALIEKKLASLCRQLEHPGSQTATDIDARRNLKTLSLSFQAADDRISSSVSARKELIENFCRKTDKTLFPACLNDEKHAAFRAKVYLMDEVLSEQECIDAKISCYGRNKKILQFDVLRERKIDYSNNSEVTAEKLGKDDMDRLEEEVKAVERKLDQLFEHVSTDEIKARQLYVKLQVNNCERPFLKGLEKSPMLEAMRDGLIPENVDDKFFTQFVYMFYADTPVGRITRPTFYVSDLKNLDTVKAELKIRLAGVDLLKPEGVSRAEIESKLKIALERVEKQNFANQKLREAALIGCYRDSINECNIEQTYTGFGSLDVVKVFKLLATCGIDIAKFDGDYKSDENGRLTPPDFDRALALMQLIKHRGGATDGIAEWFERVSGKPISELSRVAVMELFKNGPDGIVDPLDSLKENTVIGKVARFLKGEYSVAQLNARPSERIAIYRALNDLAAHQGAGGTQLKTLEVLIDKVPVKLTVDPMFRKLVGHISVEGRELPIAYPMDVADLCSQVQNEIFAHIDDYLDSEEGKSMLLGLLPDEQSFTANLSRAREICTRIISRITGKPAVDIVSLTKDELLMTARGLIDGSIKSDAVPTPILQSYNSQEAIELGSSMLADRATLEKITWSQVEEQLPPLAEREGREPSPARIRNFVADLLMNRNSWIFDVQNSHQKGDRILALLQGYAPEVRYLLANSGALEKVIVPSVKDSVVAILEQIRALAPNIAEPGTIESLKFNDKATADRLAEIDDRISGMLTETMNSLQEMISNLFAAQQGKDKQTWQRTSAEINGAGGLDVSTPQGRFMKEVLDRYFKGSSEIDQRAMLSAFIRNTQPGDTDGKLAGELIKGAGPLLQKMLQGLPVETFGKETQMALQDTRCNLAPIPPEVVNARLANMIVSSGGYISKINVVESLGAATVGQTFLCRIYTKDHPKTGEEVVIKILRPNVETAVRREYELISKIAGEQQNGMAEAFADRYLGVLKEFDFTLEAGNIDRGAVYDHAYIGDSRSTDVFAMGRNHNVMPTTGTLILNKAEGVPFSSYTRNVRKRMDDILESVKSGVSLEPGGTEKPLYRVKNRLADARFKRYQLQLLHEEVVANRKHLEQMVSAWFQQAFEGGFVHGDMHSGNIMAGLKGATVIDFGNCMFLNEKERNAVLVALSSCVFGEANSPDDPSWYLLKCLETLARETKKDRGLVKGQNGSALDDADLKRDLKVALTRGTKTDVVTRLLSSLTIIQNHGYPLPESITVITQSLSRLQAAMSDTDELLGEIEEASEAIEIDDDLKSRFSGQNDPLTQKDGGFALFRDIDRFLLDANGAPPKVDKNFRLRLLDLGENQCAGLIEQLKADNQELLYADGGLKFIDMVLKKYDNLEFARLSQTEFKSYVFMSASIEEYFRNVRLEEYRRKVKEGNVDDKERDAILSDFVKRIVSFVTDYDTISLRNLDHYSSTRSFEECGYKSLESVLTRKLTGGENALVKVKEIFGVSLGDTFSGGLFAVAIRNHGYQFFEQVKNETKTVAEVRQAFSDHSDGGMFVSRRNRRLIDKVARDLLVPPGGITKENLDEVVQANLEVLRRAVGRKHLTSAELRYFVLIAEAYGRIPSWGFMSDSYDSPFGKLAKKSSKESDRDARNVFFEKMIEIQNRHLEENGLAEMRQNSIPEPQSGRQGNMV